MNNQSYPTCGTETVTSLDSLVLQLTLENSGLFETVRELREKLKTLQKRLEESETLQLVHQEQIREYAMGILLLLQDHTQEMHKLVEDHEEFTTDLLKGCDTIFSDMKVEYIKQQGKKPASGNQNGVKIWSKLKKLSSEHRGIIVTGICILFLTLGTWVSWGFIIWLFPKLLAIAAGIIVCVKTLASWKPYLDKFIKSESFQKFLKCWNDGCSLEKCCSKLLGTEELKSIMKMAPKVFSMFSAE